MDQKSDKSTQTENTPLHKQQNITCLWPPEELGQLAESGLLGTGILREYTMSILL